MVRLIQFARHLFVGAIGELANVKIKAQPCYGDKEIVTLRNIFEKVGKRRKNMHKNDSLENYVMKKNV